MAWVETSLGVWRRPLGENESLIRRFGMLGHRCCREHWSLNISASFTTNKHWKGEIEARLRQGWVALRFQHPSIATTVLNGDGEDKLEYRTGSAEIVDEWANATFFIVDQDLSVDDSAATLTLTDAVTLSYFPRSAEILLHTPHWRTDGPGGLQLLNAFFAAVASSGAGSSLALPWGEEHARLAPSIEEALNLPTDETPEIKASVQEIVGKVAKMGPGVGIQGRLDAPAATAPGATRNARLRLSTSQTSLLIEACQRQDIHIIAAVHASVAAINHLNASPETKNLPYKSTLRFSLRPYLPSPYNTPAYASALYTSGVIFSIPASDSWSSTAKQYHEQYHAGLSKDFVLARRHYARFMLNFLSQVGRPPGPPPSEIDVSTVEEVDQLVASTHSGEDGGVEVSRVSIGIETVTRQSYVFFWVYQGQLEFNLVYNEAFYDAQFMDDLVGRLPEILQAGLQI
ncbi:hypothetical protein BJX70DRAFT_381193 [Aspergillus crustosus]